jgi:DNA mismatch repair protein MutS
MRKLVAGGSEHSFGIHVARIAGMPTSVVLRANEIMHHLEQECAHAGDESTDTPTEFDELLAGLENAPQPDEQGGKVLLFNGSTSDKAVQRGPRAQPAAAVATAPRPSLQLSMFEPADPALERVRELIQQLDVNTLTPIEALLKLNELKLALGGK